MPHKPKRGAQTKGRPTKYKPEMCAVVVAALKDGRTKAQICAELDIGWTAFNSYYDKYEEFKNAYDDNLIHAEAWWVEKIKAAAFKPSQDVNSKLIEMVMQNCYGWRKQSHLDAKVETTSGPDADFAFYEGLTDKERAVMGKLKTKEADLRGKVAKRNKAKETK